MEEIVDLSKNDVTQKPREGQIRRDEVQWTAMSISFKDAKNIQKHKIAKNLENNAETWYNFGTNKPVLVRQRYAVVL